MFLPDDPSAVAGAYIDGVPGGAHGTAIRADQMNAIVNEIANVVTGSAQTLTKANSAQLQAAIQTLVGRAQLKTAVSTVRTVRDLGGTQRLNALARARVSGVGYKNQVIAVGNAGTIQANNGPSSIFALQAPNLSYTGDFTDIAYDATLGLFIAVGKVGEIQTSNGNGSWLRRATGGNNFNAIATNGLGLCVAVGALSLIKYSINGTTWNTATNPFVGLMTITGIAFGAGMFVIGTDSGDIASSPDGITWTVRRAYAGAGSLGQVAYDPALGFLFFYSADNDVFRSADGIAWTKIHNSIAGGFLVASPFGWMLFGSSLATGTYVEVRYSPTAIDQPPDFMVDYVNTDGLGWFEFIDGQLWALGSNSTPAKLYLGGVL